MISHIFFILLIAGGLSLGAAISATDFRRRIIPDVYLFPLMLIGLILVTFFNFPTTITDSVIGATFGYILAMVIGLAFEHIAHLHGHKIDTPIGRGDIKLIGVGGLWLGTNGLAVALIASCILGALWGRVHKQKYIPFAPFFITGAIISILVG